MGFTLNLGTNRSEINEVGKSVDLVCELQNVVVKQDTSEVDPVFIVQTPYDMSKVNYVWGDIFGGRKYFVRDIVTLGHQRYELHCHCDVVDSFYDQYKSNACLALRSDNLYNLYLEDNQVQTLSIKDIGTVEGPQVGDDDSSYILITSGHVSS
jgi:hypothetical protein